MSARLQIKLRAAATLLALLAAAVALTSLPRRARAAQAEPAGRLPLAWKYWKYFRPLRAPAPSRPRLVALVVPVEVYTRARPHLADLRIIDDRGDEIPFAEITFPGTTRTTYLPRRAIEARYVPGRYTDFILDLGPRSLPCDFLALTGAASNPPALARIDASNNGRDWRLVRRRVAIGARNRSSLGFPETDTRFLRLRIFDRSGRFRIRTMLAGKQGRIPPDRSPVTAPLEPQSSTSSSVTRWRIELAGATPVDEADFETTQAAFSRQAVVFSSPDGKNWNRVGEGIIFRTARGATPDERLNVAFRPRRARYWRVELRNENDPPLAAVRLRLSMAPRRIVFRAEPGRSYRLLYGDSEADASQYDLAKTVSRETLRAAPPVAKTGAERSNAGWVDPRPWSEKHAAVLWVATLLALLLLAWAAWRALRRPQ